jgi:hypothetical protein
MHIISLLNILSLLKKALQAKNTLLPLMNHPGKACIAAQIHPGRFIGQPPTLS